MAISNLPAAAGTRMAVRLTASSPAGSYVLRAVPGRLDEVASDLKAHGYRLGRRPRGMWPSEGSVCP